jgi:hypothetical protein
MNPTFKENVERKYTIIGAAKSQKLLGDIVQL